MISQTSESTTARRPWIVLVYFYIAALAGLGFLIVGTTTALFGAKDLAFPGLGLKSYSYESSLRRDEHGTWPRTPSGRPHASERSRTPATTGRTDWSMARS
ncbi:MAG: hypothetical protein H0V92_07580 [Pseudonocardiales bacterium]|nr:hypothetical protein [Pseudonocardiales bacterium]